MVRTLRTVAILVVLLAAGSLALRAVAQMGPSMSAGKGDPTQQADFKVLKWALPTYSDNQILDMLDEIEYKSSAYGVQFKFGLAVIAAEASFGNKTAYARKRNWDLVQLMTKGANISYPPVTRDLDQALSSLQDMLRTE